MVVIWFVLWNIYSAARSGSKLHLSLGLRIWYLIKRGQLHGFHCCGPSFLVAFLTWNFLLAAPVAGWALSPPICSRGCCYMLPADPSVLRSYFGCLWCAMSPTPGAALGRTPWVWLKFAFLVLCYTVCGIIFYVASPPGRFLALPG